MRLQQNRNIIMEKERKENLLALFNENARIAKTFGMRLSYDESGRAHIYLPYNPALNHAGNGIHGGVIATMLDTAGWFTCALVNGSMLVLTAELSVHLFRFAANTSLVARGELLKAGKRQHVAEMRCWDEDNRLIAHAIGTFTNIDVDIESWT